MRTSDVYLAAALLSLGYKLDNIDRTNRSHMVFCFVPQPLTGSLGELALKELSEVETSWANGTLVGNLSKYAEAIKRMKSLIHSGQ